MQRVTKQRRLVENCLEQFSTFIGAQDIFNDLSASGQKISLSTVYRIIGEMHEENLVDMILSENNEALYRLCSQEHHHHIVCVECGITVELVDDLIENWASKIAKSNKFKLTGHQVELSGVCANCS